MNLEDPICGWRGLSRAVTKRLGRPVGVGKVRWAVESSGLDIGHKVGHTLVFGEADIDATVRLLGGPVVGRPSVPVRPGGQ